MNNGDIYVWEPESTRGYSIGWNLKTLREKGLPNKDPPCSSEELMDIIVEAAERTQQEWGGQVTFNSLDNYLAPFLEEEKPSKIDFIEQVEEFLEKLSSLNVTLTLDLIPSPDLEETPHHQAILDAVNDVLQQVYRSRMNQGRFKPNIVLNLYPETNWESEPLNSWLELSYLYGNPIIQNFITGTIGPESPRPRTYIPDTSVTNLRLGGPVGNSENQCITGYACINMAKIGSIAESEDRFYEIIDERMDMVAEHLVEKHRKVMENLENKPVTYSLTDSLDWAFSVISIVGANEALESLIEAPIGHVAGKAVTYKLLEFILRKMSDIQYETGILFSLEAHPSETAGAILLKEYESSYEYLTPGTELKPSHGDDLWDVLEHQKKFHSMYTGGTLMQIHLQEGLEYNEGLRLLIQRTLEEFGYNYIAVSPVLSLCKNHGYVKGDKNCPVCGDETEAYIRVDGSMKKISSLMESNKEAYWRRVYYDVKNE